MTCVICKHGTTAPGTATMTFDERDTVMVIRNVPAEVCGNCGEACSEDIPRTSAAHPSSILSGKEPRNADTHLPAF